MNLTKTSVCIALALTAIAFAGLALVSAQTAADADFDDDGTVGFSDFVAFAGNFGTSQGDGRYDAKYDLNGDGNVGFADFVAFAGFFGQSVPAGDMPASVGFALAMDNSRFAFGITYANDRFYVTGSDLEGRAGTDTVYAYSRYGRRDEAFDFDISDEFDGASGITYANDRFYVVINPEYTDIVKVNAYSRTGIPDPASGFDLFDEIKENALPHGIAYANGRFYVVVVSNIDVESYGATKIVYAYSRSGKRDVAFDFNLNSENRHANGITYANDRFYVVDNADKKVYAYGGL